MLKSSAVRILLCTALIMAVGILVYSNTFNSPFVFDDRIFITDNPAITELRYLLTPSTAAELDIRMEVEGCLGTRTIGFLSLWANHALHGLEVKGYHITNLAIHIANALLLYILVLITFRTPGLNGSAIRDRAGYIALLSALLFVSHPVQTESVTYITQRFGSIAAMFYLASITAYAGSRLSNNRTARWGLYALCLFSAVLAMKTKEMAFTLPVMVMLYEFMFFDGRRTRRLLVLLPLLLTMLIIPLEYIEGVGGEGLAASLDSATKFYTDMPRHEYLFTQLRVIVTYMRLIVFPINQTLDYDTPVYGSFFEPEVFLSFLFLVSLLALGVYFLLGRGVDRGGRLTAFGVFWFFLALSVESSIIPIPELMFEYRLYLPNAGAILALSTVMIVLILRLKDKRLMASATLLTILVPIIFSVTAHERNSVWKTKTGLWEDTVRKSPLKARGHYNLGLSYGSIGLPHKAIWHYQNAIAIMPDLAEAHYNVGISFGSIGRTDRAIEHLRIATALMPNDAEAHYNLGDAYDLKGMTDRAIVHYRTAIKLRPDYGFVHYRLGLVYLEKGLLDAAQRELKKVLRQNPGNEKAKLLIDEINSMPGHLAGE
jgi:tetratricopeptide (TPR) repeat protein